MSRWVRWYRGWWGFQLWFRLRSRASRKTSWRFPDYQRHSGCGVRRVCAVYTRLYTRIYSQVCCLSFIILSANTFTLAGWCFSFAMPTFILFVTPSARRMFLIIFSIWRVIQKFMTIMGLCTINWFYEYCVILSHQQT